MQFENFDNRIRQAAEQHHPNYDEKAWSKMEKLLDREMPQKKDRRRFIILLLSLLLVGIGIWMMIDQPWQKNHGITNDTTQDNLKVNSEKKTVKETTNSSDKENPVDVNKNKPDNENPGATTNEKNIPVIHAPDHPDKKVDRNSNHVYLQKTGKRQNNRITSGIKRPDQLIVDAETPGSAKKNSKPEEITSPPKEDNQSKDAATKNSDLNPQTDTDKTLATENKKNETKKDEGIDQLKKADEKNVASVTKKRRANTLSFTLSAGPDVSYVGLDNPGKIKLVGGAGIAYTIRGKVTIRTGFYSTSKIYSASKYEYKPNPSVYNYNGLDKIDANCKVHEIPVSLAYNFGNSEKQNFFVSTGLSSFIMKKETYRYIYISPSPYTYTKTINNQNKHYFSVLTLSGGYQRRVSKTLSIVAEPYVKLPLGGVGYGKVKLNSAGILFSLNLSPFQSRSK